MVPTFTSSKTQYNGDLFPCLWSQQHICGDLVWQDCLLLQVVIAGIEMSQPQQIPGSLTSHFGALQRKVLSGLRVAHSAFSSLIIPSRIGSRKEEKSSKEIDLARFWTDLQSLLRDGYLEICSCFPPATLSKPPAQVNPSAIKTRKQNKPLTTDPVAWNWQRTLSQWKINGC